MARQALSRRDLLSAGVVVGSSAALAQLPAEAKSISGEMPWAPGVANAPEPAAPGGYQFFSADEAAFIEAATSRLIPSDDLGAGAKEAGVAIFLDRQLAGPFGSADSWYMRGPWGDGTKSQGYQTRLAPAQLYRAAIKAIDEHCRTALSGKSFAQLTSAQQDEVLGDLEKGTIKLQGADAATFFDTFLQNTIEGFFSDPIYGGNRDMVGWKLIGFPGAHYDYRPYVSKHGERLNLPPVGLKGRAAWTPSK
jgi:gluconate 2-dehydrogenase gamma chain